MEPEAALPAAREALQAHAWDDAVAGFLAVDAVQPLSPDDLQALAEAAYFAGRSVTAVDACQRAHAGYVDQGRAAEAASAALGVAQMQFVTGGTTVASAWVTRAQGLLTDLPETAAHALLAWTEAQVGVLLNAYDQALDHAREAEAIALRVGARDWVALARALQGFLLVHTDDVPGGMRLLDEAAASAMAGELGPFATAEVVCEMVLSCLRVADDERAGEWLDSLDRAGREVACFPGCCRTHRATLLRHRGEWTDAYDSAERAQTEVSGIDVMHEAMALTEIGELHRCRGQLAMAERSFTEAHEKGWRPQPGLPLLLLAEGEVQAASRMVQRWVDESADQLAALVDLLPAQAEIAIAAGDTAAAASAADRLATVASALGTSTAIAARDELEGVLLGERGDHRAAASKLEASVRSWQRARMPYQAGRARMRLATALSALGDEGSARLELTTARVAFDRLGAAPEALEVARRLGDDAPVQSPRTFMFTDIVDSTALLSAIGDVAWRRLRQWHDRAVTAVVARHRGEIVKETGDGFFAAFDDPRLAVDCAITIQRALEEHRRTDGYSPAVRIGLHVGSALVLDGDYAGRDVVIASRIGASAAADQILITAALAERVGTQVRLLPAGPLALKGIAEPVEAAQVAWQ